MGGHREDKDVSALEILRGMMSAENWEEEREFGGQGRGWRPPLDCGRNGNALSSPSSALVTPNIQTYNAVLQACALTPPESDADLRRRALGVASEVLDEIIAHSNSSPPLSSSSSLSVVAANSYTLKPFLYAGAKLAEEDEEYWEIVDRVTGLCWRERILTEPELRILLGKAKRARAQSQGKRRRRRRGQNIVGGRTACHASSLEERNRGRACAAAPAAASARERGELAAGEEGGG